MIVIGIESSCDETAVAIVNSNRKVLSNIIFSQIKTHEKFGGVVPEVAAREHLNSIYICINEALAKARVSLSQIDAIAVTNGPGLIGGLLVGISTAEGLALSLNKPLIAVNHMEGHLLTPRLVDSHIAFPYLGLLISGGHSQFVIAEDVGKYQIIGSTLDDALGEAFDKTARMMNLPYPGGKHIESLAKKGKEAISFKPPLFGKKGCDFSFSGLKTQVKLKINQIQEDNTNKIGDSALTDQQKSDIALGFTNAVVKVVKEKTINAINIFKEKYKSSYFIVSGGVAANLNIREALLQVSQNTEMKFISTPIELCGDNASMIAWAGIEKLNKGIVNNLGIQAKPSFSLNDI